MNELETAHADLREAVISLTGDTFSDFIVDNLVDAIEESWWAAGHAAQYYGREWTDVEKSAVAKRAFQALIGAK